MNRLSASLVLQSFRHTIPAVVPLNNGLPTVLQNFTVSVYPRATDDGHLGPQGILHAVTYVAIIF